MDTHCWPMLTTGLRTDPDNGLGTRLGVADRTVCAALNITLSLTRGLMMDRNTIHCHRRSKGLIEGSCEGGVSVRRCVHPTCLWKPRARKACLTSARRSLLWVEAAATGGFSPGTPLLRYLEYRQRSVWCVCVCAHTRCYHVCREQI